MKTSHSNGFVLPLIAVLVALFIGGSVYVYKNNPKVAPVKDTSSVSTTTIEIGGTPDKVKEIPKDNTASPLNIISPNAGDTLVLGQKTTIRWNAPRYFRATNANLMLMSYSAPCKITDPCPAQNVTYKSIAKDISIDNHSYVWTVEGVTPGKYVIRICESGDQVCATSNKYFTIAAPSVSDSHAVTVTSPKGAYEIWQTKSVHPITWNFANVKPDSKVNIYIYTRRMTCLHVSSGSSVGQTYDPSVEEYNSICPYRAATLDKNVNANNTYNWIVGTDIDNKTIQPGDYKMQVCEALPQSENGHGDPDAMCSYSKDWFTITPGTLTQPSITVLSPNGGETIKIGSTFNIKWNSTSGLEDKVTITINKYKPECYSDGKFICSTVTIPIAPDTIVSGAANTGEYKWVVGNPLVYGGHLDAGKYQVEVVGFPSNGGSGISDVSDTYFTISN